MWVVGGRADRSQGWLIYSNVTPSPDIHSLTNRGIFLKNQNLVSHPEKEKNEGLTEHNKQPCRALGEILWLRAVLRWLQPSFQVFIKSRVSSVQGQVKKIETIVISLLP